MPGVADRHPDTPIIPVTVGNDETDVNFTKLIAGVSCPCTYCTDMHTIPAAKVTDIS